MNTKKSLISLIALLFAAALVFSVVAWTPRATLAATQMQQKQSQTQQMWTGTVKKDASGKIVLVTTDGQTLTLSPQAQVTSLVDKAVKVTGVLKGNTITVSSIEPAQ